MARGLTLLLLAGLVAAGLVVAWLGPPWLPPAARAPRLSYEVAYAEWEQALKDGRHDEALAVTDEFLLQGQDVDAYREDARGMRLLATRRGGKSLVGAPDSAEDRPLTWQLERFAARRPPPEWAALGGAGVLALLGVVAILRRPGPPPPPPEVLGPRPSLDRLTSTG